MNKREISKGDRDRFEELYRSYRKELFGQFYSEPEEAKTRWENGEGCTILVHRSFPDGPPAMYEILDFAFLEHPARKELRKLTERYLTWENHP